MKKIGDPVFPESESLSKHKMVKKTIFIILGSLISGIVLMLFLFVAAMNFQVLGDMVCCLLTGSLYRKCGETAAVINGKPETLSIYKAAHKPFLLLGPYPFEEEHRDFFFVSRTRVVRGVLDKGGDVHYRWLERLLILDDMTGKDRFRAPYWDDLAWDSRSSVKLQNGRRIYSFCMDGGGCPVSFAIPETFFTPDMGSAEYLFEDDAPSDKSDPSDISRPPR